MWTSQLTTDGLWAMPLNKGWVPVKVHRLQDWEKLKKYIPIHKQGDVCPNGVPGLWRGTTMVAFGFGILSGPLCIAPSRVSSRFQLFAQM